MRGKDTLLDGRVKGLKSLREKWDKRAKGTRVEGFKGLRVESIKPTSQQTNQPTRQLTSD
jgi:hypothetical protein